jgi:hypothetical protein
MSVTHDDHEFANKGKKKQVVWSTFFRVVFGLFGLENSMKIT